MDGMNGWMGWMGWMDGCSLKSLCRGCTCPQGPFFCEKRHFLKKSVFLKNWKIDFYEKILLFCSKNHTRRSGMKFRVDPSAERLKLIWNRTSYDQKHFMLNYNYFYYVMSFLGLNHFFESLIKYCMRAPRVTSGPVKKCTSSKYFQNCALYTWL